MSLEYKDLEIFPKGFYPELVERFYEEDPNILDLYPNAGHQVDFASQISARSGFPAASRQVLADELLRQYGDLAVGNIRDQIEKLRLPDTFTVTTGQQIHAMLGPMYVLSKAVSTILLARKLNLIFPENHIVPVFWMASEDHDFEEINHFTVFGRHYLWSTNQQGPVGRFHLKELLTLIDRVSADFPDDEKIQKQLTLFQKAYSSCSNLADATRYLLNELLGSAGLVVINPDSAPLKELFSPAMLEEIRHSPANAAIEHQTRLLREQGIKPVISARNTNLFLINGGIRERLDRVDSGFQLHSSGTPFSLQELEERLRENPADFSPNVALRPLYQETVLPNLAYVAGPGEFGYWYQLYRAFPACGLRPPALQLRRSYLIGDAAGKEKMNAAGLEESDFCKGPEFLKQQFLNTLEKPEDLENLHLELLGVFEKINSELYRLRHPDLKALKKSSDSYLKTLSRSIRQYNDDILNRPENATQWSRILKIYNRLFNASEPQERVTGYFEMAVQFPDLLNKILAVPDNPKRPITVIWI